MLGNVAGIFRGVELDVHSNICIYNLN
jgi:hypothetical protein